MSPRLPSAPTLEELAIFNGAGEYSPRRIIARRSISRTVIGAALAASIALALASFAL
jgi:hypothetical protein